MALPIRKMGWIPDVPDRRDRVFAAAPAQLHAVPSRVDLRPQFSFPIYDQGNIGSCTANAIAGAIQFARARHGWEPGDPARLFIYFNERQAEHTVPMDNGAMIRTGIKSVHKQGVCSDAIWPYDDTPADPQTGLFPANAPAIKRPSGDAYGDAAKSKVVSYMRIPSSLALMKGCLAVGFPFVVGFSVYESLYGADGTPKTQVPLPRQPTRCSGGTPCWQWVTTTRRSSSRSAILGETRCKSRATFTCHTPT